MILKEDIAVVGLRRRVTCQRRITLSPYAERSTNKACYCRSKNITAGRFLAFHVSILNMVRVGETLFV